MLTLPASIILEKNKLYNSEAFAELLEWQISETGETVRIANYNEDITWDGYTWTKFWFDGGDENDSGGDSAETIQIKVSAIDKVIQGYLETLSNGGIGDTVVYRRVHTGHLDLGAVLEATFSILNIDAGPNNEFVIFDLGQENFFLNRFPAHTFSRNICRWTPLQRSVCPYVNNSICNRTFDNCLQLHQENVFGGQPGIPGGTFQITSGFRTTLERVYLDAKLLALDETISTKLDAIIKLGTDEVFTKLNALLSASQTELVNIDGRLIKTFTSTLSLDSKLNGQVTKSLSLDALLTGFIDTSIDALIYKASQETLSLNAATYKNYTNDLSTDAYLLETITAISSLDSLLEKQQTKTAGLDAVLYSIGSYSESTKLDAVLYGDFVEDTTGTPIQAPGGDYIEEPGT